MSSSNGIGRLRATPWLKPYRYEDDDPKSPVMGWSESGEDGLFVCDYRLWRTTRIKRPAKDPRRLRIWVQRSATGALKLRDFPEWDGGLIGGAPILSEQMAFLTEAGISRGDRFDCWVEWVTA